MKKTVFTLILLGMSLLFGCEKNDNPSIELTERKDIVLTRSELDFVQENNGFALELFKRVSEMEGGKSTLISPLSVTMDFGMVSNGAAGKTQAEINSVLGYKESSVEGLNSFCQTMLSQSSKVDPSTTVEIGNAAVINKNRIPLMDSFSKTIESAYDAEVIYKEFGKDDVKGLVNKWCDKKTHGMIPSILDQQPGADSYAYFMNAVYFKGIWSEKFDKANTKDEEFRLEDGTRSKVRMMRQKHIFPMGSIDGLCAALCLPYGNEAYRMVILLPEDGKTIEDVKGGLDTESWSGLIKNMSKSEVDVKIPAFETSTDLLHLKDALMEMGIKDAFSTTSADFSNMTDEGVYINDVLHKARIKVDEQGSEAAAVTVIEMYYTSVVPGHITHEFHADHPFIYAITEVSTGAIFFIGQFTGK
ncbi:MAG: serpin family protein [Bacteroidales bacterium]|nr:serpin family protein [Bacteroidales bacterium]